MSCGWTCSKPRYRRACSSHRAPGPGSAGRCGSPCRSRSVLLAVSGSKSRGAGGSVGSSPSPRSCRAFLSVRWKAQHSAAPPTRGRFAGPAFRAPPLAEQPCPRRTRAQRVPSPAGSAWPGTAVPGRTSRPRRRGTGAELPTVSTGRGRCCSSDGDLRRWLRQVDPLTGPAAEAGTASLARDLAYEVTSGELPLAVAGNGRHVTARDAPIGQTLHVKPRAPRRHVRPDPGRREAARLGRWRPDRRKAGRKVPC